MIVLDTHALIWWLENPRKLAASARRRVMAAARQHKLTVSAVSTFEIATLLRQGRLKLRADPDTWFNALCSLPELHITPVTAAIAWRAGRLQETMPGDPVDRMIAATAIELGAVLVTADERLRQHGLQTVW